MMQQLPMEEPAFKTPQTVQLEGPERKTVLSTVMVDLGPCRVPFPVSSLHGPKFSETEEANYREQLLMSQAVLCKVKSQQEQQQQQQLSETSRSDLDSNVQFDNLQGKFSQFPEELKPTVRDPLKQTILPMTVPGSQSVFGPQEEIKRGDAGLQVPAFPPEQGAGEGKAPGIQQSLTESIVTIMHQNMVLDPGEIQKNKPKKDVLWKPILRGFRSYYRSKIVDQFGIYQLNEYQHRTKVANIDEQCKKFLQKIGAPKHIVDNPLHRHALIILVMPVAAKNLRKSLVHLPEVQANLPRLTSSFCAIFRENSKRSRLQFFQNELVQHMWQQYTLNRSKFLYQYFCDIIKVDRKKSDAYVLLKDILVLSNRLNFEVLRPEIVHACAQLAKDRAKQVDGQSQNLMGVSSHQY